MQASGLDDAGVIDELINVQADALKMAAGKDTSS
jgi:hypothetical protein